MQRSITTALVALSVVVPTHAAELSDTGRRFVLTTPDGWTNEATPGEPVALVIASPRVAETRGNCNVVVTPNSLGGRSQSEVDKIADEAVNNEAFWKSVMATVTMFKSSKVETFGARDQNGRKVFFAKVTSDAVVGNVSATVTQVQDMHPTPGTTFGLTCTALAQTFALETADFDAIRYSFKPDLGLTVAWNRAPVYPAAVRGATARFTRDAFTAGVMRAARR